MTLREVKRNKAID